MDSSLLWTLDGGFQLREGKSSRYPTATRAQLKLNADIVIFVY